jgi:hypothetical protein
MKGRFLEIENDIKAMNASLAKIEAKLGLNLNGPEELNTTTAPPPTTTTKKKFWNCLKFWRKKETNIDSQGGDTE